MPSGRIDPRHVRKVLELHRRKKIGEPPSGKGSRGTAGILELARQFDEKAANNANVVRVDIDWPVLIGGIDRLRVKLLQSGNAIGENSRTDSAVKRNQIAGGRSDHFSSSLVLTLGSLKRQRRSSAKRPYRP